MTRSRGVIMTVLVAALVACAIDVTSAQAAPFGAPHPAGAISPSGLIGWIFAQQAAFYRSLSGFIRASKEDSTAMWGLFGISFLYGVFHAVGPGHGKAVISSYLVANEETWRRGIVLSFASAGIQSVVAIVVVAIAAVLLGATAKAIGLTVHLVEVVSYGLVILIGLRLFYVKGRGFLLACRELTWTPAPVLALTSGYGSKTLRFPTPRRGAMTLRGGQCTVDGCASHEHGFHCHDEHHEFGLGPRPRARAR